MKLLTPKEVMAKYHYKKSTFYSRRLECMVSDFSDAVIMDGQRKTLIKEDRWEAWLEWRSEQAKKKYFGLI